MTAHTDYDNRIANSSLRDHAAELLAFVRPAIELQPVLEAGGLTVGSTRSGGLPDVAPNFEWPRARWPLSFLLQLNLAEVSDLPAAAPLPTTGLLSFYYDLIRQPWGLSPAEHNRWRVIYTPAEVPLHRVAVRPSGLTPRACLPAVALIPVGVDTMPYELPLDPEELDDVDADPEHAYCMNVLPPDTAPVHQLLGYPRPIQSDDFGVASCPGGKWVSLLQLDTDPRLGISFGDSGKLHWYMRVDDLLTRRFEATSLSLQCC